jgi:hypothetical protein
MRPGRMVGGWQGGTDAIVDDGGFSRTMGFHRTGDVIVPGDASGARAGLRHRHVPGRLLPHAAHHTRTGMTRQRQTIW